MHYLSTCILLITILIVINARSPSPLKSLADDYRSCPEEYRELRRRDDEVNSELDDDEYTYEDETLETVCEQAMDIIIRHRNIAKYNPSILLNYCPHYDERLALARENNNTLCENKKQELNMKRERKQLQRKQDDDYSDNDDDDNKRRALRRRELKKRVALRFIRKRMS